MLNLMKKRNCAIPAAYLILRRGDNILLMRRRGSGYYDGWYSVPAGHIESGELPKEAIIREAHEEIGITITKEQLHHVHTMYRPKHDETGDRLDIFFSADVWQGEPAICEPTKCDDLAWFKVSSLPQNTMHHVRSTISSIGKNNQYTELNLKEIVKNPSQ